MSPTVYSALASTVLGLFAVYGMIGNFLGVKELGTFPEKGEWPFSQMYTVYLMLCVNGFYIVAGFFGLVGLLSSKKYLFLWSAFILLGSFAVQLLHGVACLRASSEDMSKEIFSTFRRFQDDQHYMKWLLDFQWQYDCCGIKSYMDWTLLEMSFSNYSVPDSCCRRKEKIPIKNCGYGLVAPLVPVENARQIINTQGCGSTISSFSQRDIKSKGCIMLVAAFISLFSGLFLFGCQNRFEEAGGQKTNGARPTSRGVRRLPRTQQERAMDARRVRRTPSVKSQNTEMNGNVEKVPSYYKNAVIHKPPTGRMNRQDSSRNIQQTKAWGQKQRYNSQRSKQQKYLQGQGLQNQNQPQPHRPNRKSSRSEYDYMKTKLEMLMHPIETRLDSTTSANASDLFPFYGRQTSSSACFQPSDFEPRTTSMRGGSKNVDPKIAHYNSLPQVVTFPDGRVETLYHYNTSHLHAQNMRRKHSQRQKCSFVEGKYPSLTIASTLATIHEENESVKSGSACTTTAISSPKSLSKTPSAQNYINVNVENECALPNCIPTPTLTPHIAITTTNANDTTADEKEKEKQTGENENDVVPLSLNCLDNTNSNTNLPTLKSTRNFGRRLGAMSKTSYARSIIDPMLVTSETKKNIGVTRKGSTFVAAATAAAQESTLPKPQSCINE